MTNQKTPEQGGATEEQINAAVAAVLDADTMILEGGDPRSDAENVVRIVFDVLASYERHDAEEREPESEDHAATVTGDPTSMQSFHQSYPEMPDLWHTYCSEHPDFGTCAEEAQAQRDIDTHLASAHGVLPAPSSDREKLAARLRGDILDAVPDDNDMQHVLELAAAALVAPVEVDAEALREARAETWDEAIAAVHAWWSMPPEKRPAVIVNPYGVGLRGEGR